MDLKLPCALALGFLCGAALFGRATDPGAGDDLPAPLEDSAIGEAERQAPPRDATVLRPRIHGSSRRPLFIGPSTPTPTEDLHGMLGKTVTETWRAEVRDWIESEAFLEHLEESPTAMGEFLFQIHLSEEDPEGAERVLRELPDPWTEQWIAVADLYRARGDVDRATDLYLEGFRRWPTDEELLDPLLELAPERALALLESAPRAHEIDWQNREEYRALLLLLHRVGRVEEAKALFARLDAKNELDDRCMRLLKELDPEEAERRLLARTELKEACGTLLSSAGWDLLDHLERQGRTEEVVSYLLGGAENITDISCAHARLVRLAPERWAEVLRQQLEAEEEPSARSITLSWIGDCEMALGNEEKALDCWLEGMETNMLDEWMERAFAVAPDRTLFRLEPLVRAADDEYYWGHFGDMCWRAGRSMQAVTSWRRARELEPESEDWFDRLERIALDEDPLALQDDDVWWALDETFDY